MKSEDFVYFFKKDCEYYDPANKELKAILSLTKFKQGRTLLDIGAGTGRLAVPLSEFLKVTAIDPNALLLEEIQAPAIKIIKKKVEEYHPKKKFDYALIAWPEFENYVPIFVHIKKNILKRDGKLILVKSSNHDLKEITKTLFPETFGKQKGIFSILKDFFKIEKERIIETEYIFPTRQEAKQNLLFGMEAFYGKKVKPEQEHVLDEFIKKHERSGRIYLKAKVRIVLCLPGL